MSKISKFQRAHEATYASIAEARAAFILLGFRTTEQGDDYCVMIGNSDKNTRNVIKLTKLDFMQVVPVIKSQWYVEDAE